ncbi:MAG: GAP family protein [Patescibacteria group bacterium]|nr:GAP family protein [Patescibacteria group bacterium]
MLSKKFFILLLALAALFGLTLLLRASPQNLPAAASGPLSASWFLSLLLAAALVDSINPCAFSVLLLTIGFLFSLGRERKSILQIGSAYIFGIFVIYVAIGLGILKTLQLFNTPHFAAKAGAWLIIALGVINLINEFFPKFPIKLKIPQVSHRKIATLMEKASLPAAFVLGCLVGLFEFPCTGGPYLVVLGLLHDSGTYWLGFWYLVLYNFIFVLPLIVILLLASEKSFMDKVQAWKKSNTSNMRLYGGLAAVAIGVLILLL